MNWLKAYGNARQAFRSWNQVRKARKAGREHTTELIELEEDPKMGKEILMSLARHAVPAASAFLAGIGIHVGEGASPVLVVTAAGIAYGAMQVWSIVRKVKNKPRGQ